MHEIRTVCFGRRCFLSGGEILKGEKILRTLEEKGFRAYWVGGCVRDCLRGREPKDADITTDAFPEQVMSVFSQYTVIPTGIAHGTVTVVAEGIPFEITTFRVDGKYSDSRRPDQVRFTSSIEEDLSRRDFTMNAIAMDLRGNIVDPFGGQKDIQRSLIRCVGIPEKRFSEDALRIIRGVRFASQLGFSIDRATSNAIHHMRSELKKISPERLRDELDKTICGENCVEALLEYSDAAAEIVPEIAPSIGFHQHSDYHKYTVWEHTLRAMSEAPTDDLLLRRALFFHDIGKPECGKFDEKGKCHFKGHSRVSAEMTKEIMKKLRYDKESVRETALLIQWHGEKIKNRVEIKKLLRELGEKRFLHLLEMKSCDDAAKNTFVKDTIPRYLEIARTVGEIVGSGECFCEKQLDISGDDLKELGYRGKEIGDKLKEILDLVIENKLKNSREYILEYLKKR